MQALGAAQHRGQRFQCRADDVVVRILFGEAPARGLDVGPQHGRFGVFRVEGLDQVVPQEAGSPQHGDLHEKVHAHAEEKAQPRGEGVDVQACGDGCADIFEPVGQGEGGLEHAVGAGLHHVVAADADRVELGHVFGAVGDDVRNDAHGGRRRIDIGVAGQVFFEDIVLDGAGKLLLLDALFLGGHDVAGQDGQDGAVHGHGDAHLVQGNLVEKHFHIFDRIDGYAGFAHVAHDPGVVRIVAAVGGQVEGHGKPLLAGGQIAAVKGIGFPGRRKTGILADGPGASGIHGGHGAADIGGEAGHGVDVGHAFQVLGGIKRVDPYPLRGVPREVLQGFSPELLGGQVFPFLQIGMF